MSGFQYKIAGELLSKQNMSYFMIILHLKEHQ
jgi:hypothetical protein